MFILGWGTVTADADYGLYALFHSSQFGAPGNRTFWSDPRVDELLDLGRPGRPTSAAPSTTRPRRSSPRRRPGSSCRSRSFTTGTRDNVAGFVNHPTGSHRLYNVTKN
jgi:peptide/nickel transport system substrate-binding protein